MCASVPPATIRLPSAPRVTATAPAPASRTILTAPSRSAAAVIASSWSEFGRNQSTNPSSGASRSMTSGAPGRSRSMVTSVPPALAAASTAASGSPPNRPSTSGPPTCSTSAAAITPRSTSPGRRCGVAPGTCSAGRSPFGLIGSMVAEVCGPGMRARWLVSTPRASSRDTSRRARSSSPIAPIETTRAPSLARSTAVPAAVPAAVSRISSSSTLPWPGGIAVTGRPRMSRMCAPRQTTSGDAVGSVMPGLRGSCHG